MAEAIGTVAACAQLVQQIGETVMALYELYEAIKDADANLISLIAQLNTMKAALEQIQVLMDQADYDQQLQTDLSLVLRASELHMAMLEKKVAKVKLKKGGSGMMLKSKLGFVFDSKTMAKYLDRLDHQAGALTLLISVLTSKSVTEQKTLLRRRNTRKVFKQLQDDTTSIHTLQQQDEDDELDKASVHVLRDDESIAPALLRSRSEQVISKDPWKRFGFDRQLLASRPYGNRRWHRSTGSVPTKLTEAPVEDEDQDDAVTLVEEPGRQDDGASFFDKPDTFYGDMKSASMPVPELKSDNQLPYSRMLAIGHMEANIPDLITCARQLWEAPAGRQPQRHVSSSRLDAETVYPLKTRYFDMSIHYQPIHPNYRISDDIFARFKDVSSILIAVNLANYCHAVQGTSWLAVDLQLFDRLANDYHLWLAKIILFLDTTGLDQALEEQPADAVYLDGVDEAVQSIRSRFLRAGRMGASNDRIHVHVGEPDEAAAGAIFAITNHARQTQSNKWGGLTRYATS